ncbi:hypothetical protein TCAL_11477 [Tigriopus californicus]|uniref:START domain-containing protein n=1 Tax=Tigriopus californicus TaxID=6832 RepID=A0A553NQD1_TIGCA|nr:steroidogenic acute regulatory protein, mitochondrial-like [Tigriopus californicus]XP_059082340.1 steroidogenic acute regulatory protein, mitochondrial-like [Tigriopus californicus]TRY67636.1 hypothetical protein TCAL_11477 [Tigriopus californicus]|eukprot:TCALIF_11477-PA protein Name:"Similar to STAR Steroidogenic acute regulatory protein, mitochondrial (Ovis aries)" AED:0.00 eAED:0.00 QI:198/1/1/1/0.8/0.66/6/822/272
MEDFNHQAVIEKAFLASWETINLSSGWQSAGKTAKISCDNVDQIEWRHVGIASQNGHKLQSKEGRNTASSYSSITVPLGSVSATKSGDVGVRGPFSRGGSSAGRKAFRISATLNANMEMVANLLRDVNSVANWNKALQATRIVKRLDPDMVITYQLTAANGNLLFPRDFVFGVKYGMMDNCFVAGGCSVDYPALPQEGDLVRAWNYPGCMVVRPIPGQADVCLFQWLLDCDYGGWMPQSLFEFVVPFSQVMLVDSMAKELGRIKKEQVLLSL